MRERNHILYETVLSNDIDYQGTVFINDDVYNLLWNSLRNENTSKTAQPNLIVGEAGCGKTFLLKRLAHSIGIEKGETLRPVLIEGKTLFSTEDIWQKCALHLNIGNKDCTFDDILVWQEKNSLRIVLIIDNIQYYFGRTDNADHFSLRGKLNRTGSPILIAASDKVLPAFTDYEAAFFDGFKISYFKPVNSSSIASVLNGKYDMSRIERIMEYTPKTIRSVLIATEILGKSKDAASDLELLTDYFFSYYQTIYDASLTQTQIILSALAGSDNGISLSEIRSITGQDSGKLSPYLRLLADKGIINKESKSQRNGIYSIADPLFKLWLRNNAI